MKKRGIYIACGVVFLLAAAFFGVKIFQGTYAPAAVTESMSYTAAPAPTEAPEATAVPAAEPAAETEEATPAPTATPEPYVSPIDFESLQAVNPDIIGWITILDTNIDYPVLQSPTDDDFYMDHNSDGRYSSNGSIFSDHEYNAADFSDPVTILYGHHMASGAMFGRLQKYYSDPDFWEPDHYIHIYTPERELAYKVFAALPFSSDNLLYYYDFTDEKTFESFFDAVFNARDLSAHFKEEYAPEPGDQVIILSTCLIGNNTRRFLVMGTLVSDDQSS